MSTRIVIIGAGPAGLMAAYHLALSGYAVDIYDQHKAPARKFLVAGSGGFNITHSLEIDSFICQYDTEAIAPMIQHWSNNDTITWLQHIGIPTYKGSSGKIFPQKGIKPIAVLQAWLQQLDSLGVNIHMGYRMIDFDDHTVSLEHDAAIFTVNYDYLIFGLGGASWPQTGATATWVPILQSKGIEVSPLLPSNSGIHTLHKYSNLAGKVLKNIAVSHDASIKKGEIVFTDYGIEGAPIYYLNKSIRKHAFPTTIYIDLKPQWSLAQCMAALNTNKPISNTLRTALRLSDTAMALLKMLDKDSYTNVCTLAQYIKAYPIIINGFRPIEEVISTAGGVAWSALDKGLALRKYPNIYCIGEMVDWDAPTGGYLLQACFSMGAWAAADIIKKST